MLEIPLYAADFSPAPVPRLVGCAPNALCFSTLVRQSLPKTGAGPQFEKLWLAADGSGLASPSSTLFDVVQGGHGTPRIDPIAPGWRLEVQARPMALVLIARAVRTVIELPRALRDDVLALPNMHAPSIDHAREIDTLVIHGKHCAWWVPVARLVEAGKHEGITWQFRRVHPTSNHSARDEGIVVISAYGRTNIRIGDRALMIGETPLEKGEKVTLVDKLSDANGILRYREIERANGERIELAPSEPGGRETDVTSVSTSRGTAAAQSDAGGVVIPASLQSAIDAMQREGLLADMNASVYASLTRREWDPSAAPPALFDLVFAYYCDTERATKDAAAAVDEAWPDAPLLERLAAMAASERPVALKLAGDDGVEARVSTDVHHISLAAGTMDVVDWLNRELKHRKASYRIFSMDGDDPRTVYIRLPSVTAKRLRKAGLPLDDVI